MLMVEYFKNQDWVGTPHESVVNVVVAYFSDSFHKKSADLFLGR